MVQASEPNLESIHHDQVVLKQQTSVTAVTITGASNAGGVG